MKHKRTAVTKKSSDVGEENDSETSEPENKVKIKSEKQLDKEICKKSCQGCEMPPGLVFGLTNIDELLTRNPQQNNYSSTNNQNSTEKVEKQQMINQVNKKQTVNKTGSGFTTLKTEQKKKKLVAKRPKCKTTNHVQSEKITQNAIVNKSKLNLPLDSTISPSNNNQYSFDPTSFQNQYSVQKLQHEMLSKSPSQSESQTQAMLLEQVSIQSIMQPQPQPQPQPQNQSFLHKSQIQHQYVNQNGTTSANTRFESVKSKILLKNKQNIFNFRISN